MPVITLDFQNSRQLDPRITFERSSAASPDSLAMVNGKVQQFDANVPRLSDKGLLIEEMRINSARDTVEMNPGWNNTIITNNTSDTNAPNGTQTANKVTPATGTNGEVNRVIQGMTSTDDIWSASFYIKGGTGTAFNNIRVNFASQYQFDLDLENGVVGGINFGVVKRFFEVGDGWWYVSAVDNGAASNSNFSFRLTTNGGDNTNSYYLWGVQVERGQYSTSWIPTIGSTTATRAPDQVVLTGEDFTAWYGFNTAGSVVLQADIPLNTSGDQSLYQMAYGTSGANAGTNIKINPQNQIRLNSKVIPTGQRAQLNVPDTDTVSKFANVKPLRIAGSYSTTTTLLTCNAPFPFTSQTSSVGADTTPPTLINLGWNEFGSDDDHINGYLQSIQFYNTAFDDDQLEALVE